MLLSPGPGASPGPFVSHEHFAASAGPLGEVDTQLLMDIGVRLRYGDAAAARSGCRDFMDAVCDVPARRVLSHGVLVDALCHALCRASAAGDEPFAREAIEAVHAIVARLPADEAPSQRSGGPAASVAPALHCLLAECLRSGFRLVSTASTARRAAVALLARCGPGGAAAPEAGPMSGPQLGVCTRLALEALAAVLHSARRQVGSLSEAMGWFACLGANASGGDGLWPEPLVTHDWTLHSLAALDVLVALLQQRPRGGEAEDGGGVGAALPLLGALLLDHRLLFERPGIADALRRHAARLAGEDEPSGGAPQLGGEGGGRRALREAVGAFDALGELLGALWATEDPAGGELSEDGAAELARLRGLERGLRLISLGDDALAPTNVAAGVVAAVADLGARPAEASEAPLLGAARRACLALCCRLAACPHMETQEQFFAMLEAEPDADWLYRSEEFLLDSLFAGRPRAARSVVKWRQGDCEAACSLTDTDGVGRDTSARRLLDIIEAARPEVSPTSFASNLRRLFAADAAAREAAVLLLWRQQGAAAARHLAFDRDPAGGVAAESRGALRSYVVGGLKATAQDLEHLLGIVANPRLGWDVRASAMTQLATFVVSHREGTLALLARGQRDLGALLLDLLRSTGPPPGLGPSAAAAAEAAAAAGDGDDARTGFFVQACQTASVLLLLDSAGLVRGALAEHRGALLERLAPLAFLEGAGGARAAAVQLLACLLFDEAILGADAGDDDAPQQRQSASEPRLAAPPWLRTAFPVLPVPLSQAGARDSPAVRFWAKPPCGRTKALCQVFNALRTQLGFEPDFAGGALMAEAGRGRRSVVRRLSERALLQTHSAEETLAVAKSLALVPPMGAALLQSPGYLARLLGGVTRPPHLDPGLPSGFAAPGGYAAGVAKRAAAIEMHTALLDHVLALLQALPDGSLPDPRPLEQLAEAFCAQLLPTIVRLVFGGEMEASGRAAAVLAAEPRAVALAALALRVSAGLAHRREVGPRKMLSPDWSSLLSALLASSVPSLKRLSLALAVALLPAAMRSSSSLGVAEGGSSEGEAEEGAAQGRRRRRPGPRSALEGDAFGAAVMRCLTSTSASAASFAHAFELKVALWLVGKMAAQDSRSILAKLGAGGLVACLMPWVAHVDHVVQALAWRALRAVLCRGCGGRGVDADGASDDERGGDAGYADCAAVVARALRTLRRRADDPDGEVAVDDGRLARTEALELVRAALEAAGGDAGQLQAYVHEVVEAGILTGDIFADSLGDRRCRGLQRSAVRLLRALVGADFAAVNTLLVNAGLWPRIVAAAAPVFDIDARSCAGGGPAESALDVAGLAGDAATLAAGVGARDAQMLIWLCMSTEFLGTWRSALEGLAKHAGRSPPSSVRVSGALLVHLRALIATMRIMQTQLSPSDEADVPGLSDDWAPLRDFLQSRAVLEVIIEGLRHERADVAVRRCAVGAAGLLFGLALAGGGGGACEDCDLNEVLGSRAYAALLWSTSLPQAALDAEDRVALTQSCCCCLANALRASPAAAGAAWRAGLLRLLAASASGRGRAAGGAIPLVWALRMLAALPSASRGALEEATAAGGASGGPAAAAGGDSPRPPALAAVVLALRPQAEREDAILMEVLEVLLQCLFADRDSRSGTGVAAMLLRYELIPWLMRCSQRKQVPCAVYCKLLGLLAECSGALTGKPILLRFVAGIVEMLKPIFKGQQFNDELRCKRLQATFHFLASLRLCARSASLLVGGEPSAHTPLALAATGQGGADQVGGLGMDAWLDVVEAEVRSPGGPRAAHELRSGALRVLLAVAISGSPQSKAAFLSSSRALPLLLRLLRRGRPPLPALAMSLLWALAHNYQRAVPPLRRLRVVDAVKAWAEVSRDDPAGKEEEQSDERHGSYRMETLAAEQLTLILA